MLRHLAGAVAALLLTVGTAQAASITLYSEPEFRGERITLNQDVADFGYLGRWDDRARSLVVHSGSWEVCRRKDFDRCRTLAPGARIGHLGEIRAFADISSLRLLDMWARPDPRWDDRRRDDGRWDDPRWDDRRWDDRRWDDRRWEGRDRDRWPGHHDDDDIVWDDWRHRPAPQDPHRLSACQQTVHAGFVERYRYRAPVRFEGDPRDGVIWWNGEPWRYRCGRDRINIWQESRW